MGVVIRRLGRILWFVLRTLWYAALVAGLGAAVWRAPEIGTALATQPRAAGGVLLLIVLLLIYGGGLYLVARVRPWTWRGALLWYARFGFASFLFVLVGGILGAGLYGLDALLLPSDVPLSAKLLRGLADGAFWSALWGVNIALIVSIMRAHDAHKATAADLHGGEAKAAAPSS